ncbi:MAG TPA: TonB family protein [Ramlibacter sp.]|nr:TonB family protein [Ramlibacter sp.]HZY19375.1 TonB family protein [Ramlibacter sp.]
MSPALLNRNTAIAGGVLLLHVAALWALQSGLLRRTAEVIVPAAILTEIISAPPPVETPPPPAPPPPPVRVEPTPPPRKVQAAPKRPAPTPAPQPVATPDPTPVPAAPVGVSTPQPPAPPVAAPVAPSPAPAPALAPARVELPSTDADYLQNPKPAYPPMSKRLGEQGKVIVRVLIGTDGTAQKAEVAESSGFERLDQAAVNTVLKWRYVPGRRGGVPETMWFRVPINFVLE